MLRRYILLFELTKRTIGLCDNKKSGTLSQNEMDSSLLGLNILELRFIIENKFNLLKY